MVYIYQNLRAIRRARDEPLWCPELNYDLAADADADEPPSEFEAEELASWWKDYCVEHADDATKLAPPPDDDDDDDVSIDDTSFAEPEPTRGRQAPPMSGDREQGRAKARRGEAGADAAAARLTFDDMA